MLHRAASWLVAVAVLAVMVAGAVWARQIDAARERAEARAAVAESELVLARASLTAIVEAQAQARATAEVRGGEPGPFVEQALNLLFAAYQEPTEVRLRALSDVFAPAALAIVRLEAEHLLSSGWHLGGDSRFTVEILSTTPTESGRVQVRTRERWVYDEVDKTGQRQRCLVEEGELVYTMRRAGLAWVIEEIELGPSRRSEC